MQSLGTGWSGRVTATPRPNMSSGGSEFYAVVLRASVVTTCPGPDEILFVTDNDGGIDGTRLDLFSREPASGCFRAENFDFLVAAYHARWAEGDAVEIADEVARLDQAYQEMRATFPSENTL